MFFRKLIKTSLFPNNKGFGIIEALIGITIAAMLLTLFTTLILQTIKINHANTNGLKATMYLQELIEIAKDLEHSDWDEIATSNCTPSDINVCYPSYGASNNWIFEEGLKQELENSAYARWLTIENVCRDQTTNEIKDCAAGNVVVSTSTKKVTAYISWYNGFNDSTSTIETYVYTY